jgi:chemotaxis protein MotB
MKKVKAPEKDNSERWLVTYSDLMNLLLILFIILYAMSQVDKAKAEAVAESIRSGFGYVENGGTGASEGEGTGLYGLDFTEAEGGNSSTDPNAGTTGNDVYWSPEAVAFQKFYDDIIKLIEQHNLENAVDVKIDDRGVVISFKDNVLFNSGKANLGSESLALIDQIGTMLKSVTFSYLLVEGHTDTDPIHTAQYIDNMDLSTQRAANVWRELVACGLPADKMASIGYGEFKPVVDNDTPEHKAMNRRVVITILRHAVNATDQIVSGAAEAGNSAAEGNTAG